MPESDEYPSEEVGETTNDTTRKREQGDPVFSTPGIDFAAQATKSHPQETTLESVDEAFDSSVLTKSSNLKSMGRLGKYEVLELIGRGGMGVVLRGFDESLGRHVAIKVLSRRLANSSTARRRFTREARAVAAISHPNVITIHAVEEQSGQPFLVMEFADGGSLHDRIKKQVPLPLEEVLRLGSQIASGLAAAHEQGVIHRDIKPGNVMLEQQVDRIKITDFGLARITMDNSDLTSQGNQLGTPAYMSPEQVQGLTVDDRTDLFSLGCVLYAMIAGKSPFRGAHAFDTARKILEETPLALNELDDSVPPFLAEIVNRLLEKEPKKRYQTATEVADVLNHYLSRLNQTGTDELHAFKERTLPHDWPTRSIVGILAAVLLVAVIIVAAVTVPRWTRAKQRTDITNSDPSAIDTSSVEPPRVASNALTVSESVTASNSSPAESSLVESQERSLDRDAVIAEKFGDQFQVSFQSDGRDTGSGTATSGIGNKDSADYSIVHPAGWPLVGFNFTTYEFKDDLIIKTMQPIFRDATGKTETSEMVGRLHPKCEFQQVIADRGYAVSGIEAIGGDRLHSLKIIFRRIDAAQDLSDGQETYQSPWYGGSVHQRSQTVGGTDSLAIGVICSFKIDIHQIGLVLDDRQTAAQ